MGWCLEWCRCGQGVILYSQKAKGVLECVKGGVAGRAKEVIFLFCSTLATYCIQLSQHKKYMDMLERVQKGTMKIIRWVEHLFCEEGLRELRLLSLEKRVLLGNLIATLH